MMNHATDPGLFPSRREAEADARFDRQRPIAVRRYFCTDPWCTHADNPHSHPCTVSSNSPVF